MKIIGINSSLRGEDHPASQHRSFTRELLAAGLEHVAKKYDDAETEIIDLGDYHIGTELGTYSSNENHLCMPYPDERDEMAKLYEKIVDADGIIFSSPTYWGYPSALLKSFMERLTPLDEISDDPTKRRLQGKVAGAISTSKFDGSSRVAQDILSMANYLGFLIPPHAFAFHTGRMTTSVVEDDEDFEANYFAMRNAKAVVENVYIAAKATKGQNWKVFQEFTHPLSEDQEKGTFDFHKEKKRLKDNGFYRKENEEKGFV